jgi:hypothetical protein
VHLCLIRGPAADRAAKSLAAGERQQTVYTASPACAAGGLDDSANLQNGCSARLGLVPVACPSAQSSLASHGQPQTHRPGMELRSGRPQGARRKPDKEEVRGPSPRRPMSVPAAPANKDTTVGASDVETRDWSATGPWALVAPWIASDLAGLADEHLVTTIPHVDKAIG